ncbi:MAG: tetratricopeptide repeat-containing sensor histidine kinase [Paludibacteraceae bacterium]|nr:tetratricopeptide repeat-containing sensor histidine kinase [Paludibacteraceae bacterium]
MKRHLLLLLSLFCACAFTARADLRETSMALVDSAYAEAMVGNLSQAVLINNEGLEGVPEDSVDIRCEFYSCLLYCYHRLGDYEKALEYGEVCLQYDELQGNSVNLSASLGNLAGIYSSAGQQDVAIDYLERAIAIEQELLRTDSAHTPKSLAIREAMLGEVLLAKDSDLNRALALTEDALTIDRLLGRRLQEGMRLAQLGHIYAALGQTDRARRYNTEALAIARETGNIMTEVLCLLQLERYEEAATIAHEKGLKKQEYEACNKLYAQAKSANKQTEALIWLERARELREQLMSEENQRQLTIAQVRYDSFRKEQQLAEQQQELQQKRAREKVLWLFSLLSLIVVVLLIFLIVLLRHRKQTIEQAAADKARQYSILSHDLKNPIVAQQQVLKHLYTDYTQHTPEEVYTRIGQLLAASNGQLDLLRNLQEIVQLNRHLRAVHPTHIDLSALLRETITDVESAAILKNIAIEVRAKRLLVTVDRDSLRTILRNLLGNAIKFSPTGSTIELGTTDSGFYVRDHGMGIDETKRQELLTATTQVRSSVGTEEESGTGFGLLLCRELLKLNHGTMEIDSALGQGTTITIHLPI